MRDLCPLYHRKQILIARAPMPAKRVGIEEHAMKRTTTFQVLTLMHCSFAAISAVARTHRNFMRHLLYGVWASHPVSP